MEFPKTLARLEDVSAKIKRQVTEMDNRLADLENQRRMLNGAKEAKKFFGAVLHGLMNSWRSPDPGKDQDAFFFITKDSRERAVVRELLPQTVEICKNKDEWERYLNSLGKKKWWSSLRYEKVPPWYAVVHLSAVAMHHCPSCSDEVPLVEQHAQIEDGPEGDTWMQKKLAVCSTCMLITEVTRKDSSSRFT